jgi:hypothetical protein
MTDTYTNSLFGFMPCIYEDDIGIINPAFQICIYAGFILYLFE